MTNFVKLTSLAALLALAFAGPANANLVGDGGFELDDGSWSFAGPSGITTGVAFGLGPNSGNNYGFFGSNSPGGSISQSLSLLAGDYTLAFYLGQRGGGSANTTVTLSFGPVIAPLDYLITTPSGVWTQYSYDFSLASDTTATLSFSEVNASISRGPGLDDVSLTMHQVPTPAPLALIGLGLAGFGLANRRRRV
jgi:hypothetical protein